VILHYSSRIRDFLRGLRTYSFADSFADSGLSPAAILQGRDPLQARVLHSVSRQPLVALGAWAERHTTPADVLLIEASANTFTIAERLGALGRQVVILESHRAGQVGKSYLANTSSRLQLPPPSRRPPPPTS
jgi:hypothetical protein